MDTSKRKKKTLTELAIGSGLLILFLPLILLAIFWTAVAIGVGLLLTLVMRDNSAAFVPMVMVYGALLTVMIFVTIKFSTRFRLLFRRLLGILQERRRIQMLGITHAEISPDDTDNVNYTIHLDEVLRDHH